MAVLRLLLAVLAREYCGTDGAAEFSRRGVEDLTVGSFAALQHHPAEHTPREAHEWSKAATLFRGLVQECAWCPWSPAQALGAEEVVGDAPAVEPVARAVTTTLSAPPSDAELFSLVSRIDSNVFGIFGRECTGQARVSLGRNVDLIGHGIYLGASMFNHSCEPNCSVSNGIHRLEVAADQDVEAGSELTIAYCDILQPLAARRRELLVHYRFECICDRCAAEAAGESKVRLSYGSGGGPPKAPLSKREKREKREQRAAARSARQSASSANDDVRSPSDSQGGADSGVTVTLELRVLLKLGKSCPAARGKASHGGGSASSSKKQSQPVPVCVARLRLVRHESVERV